MNKNKCKILIFFYIIIINLSIAAPGNDTLNKIENELFGFSYSGEKMQNRVERLEKTVYGKIFKGDINNRITKLSGDISADVIGLEIKPVRDTFADNDKEIYEENANYPIVNDIEQKLFNKIYNNRDFHTRIVTIEKKLFGKIYDVDDYSTRMERIKEKIYPESSAQNYYEHDDYSEFSYNFNNDKHKKYKMPFGQRNYTRPYTNYGDFASNNDIIAHDNLSDDLSQLEYDVFGTEFSSDDVQTRIKRLNSVNKAKKTSKKYDSQKFNQHMSTAMEIGAMILMILAMVL